MNPNPAILLSLIHPSQSLHRFMASISEERESKRSKRTQENEQPTTAFMESLPRDIALDILSRLPVTSIRQFKFVCRSWRILAEDERLPNLHLNRLTETNDPYLLLHCDYPIRNQLYFVDRDADMVRKIDIPFKSLMPEFEIVASCNGLLCLSNSLYYDQVFIYNPFTRDYIELPKATQFMNQNVVFGFGFHPKTGEYKVVRLVYYRVDPNEACDRLGHVQSETQIYKLGTDSWRSKGPVPYLLQRRPSDALVNGVLHWITRRLKNQANRFPLIVSFDLGTEEFREIPTPDFSNSKFPSFRLGVLGGCLSAIIHSIRGGEEIWVMKDYNVKESWIKEFVIGNYVPIELKEGVHHRPFHGWRNGHSERQARHLCLLKNGDILMEYRSKALVYYDPDCEMFNQLTLSGLPNWFQTIVHVGSLISIENAVRMQKQVDLQ